jgi:hypothetical protein
VRLAKKVLRGTVLFLLRDDFLEGRRGRGVLVGMIGVGAGITTGGGGGAGVSSSSEEDAKRASSSDLSKGVGPAGGVSGGASVSMEHCWCRWSASKEGAIGGISGVTGVVPEVEGGEEVAGEEPNMELVDEPGEGWV